MTAQVTGMSGHSGLQAAVFAGDASGDYQTSQLIPALRSRMPGLRVWGVGGRRMLEAGIELLYDTSQASAIGFVQAFRLIAPLIIAKRKALKRSLAEKPDFVLAVDFGAFNLRLAPELRTAGIPVAYWFPPGSWRRWRPSERIVKAADYFISPYPWYANSLREAGAKADFLGHPLLDQVRPRLSKEQFLRKLDLPGDSELVALLPGSRGHEIETILPVLVEAAAILAVADKKLAFVVPISDHYPASQAARLTAEQLRKAVGKGLPEPRLSLARMAAQESLCHASAAAICSGSATLEALVAATPMVIVYRGTRMMQLEYRVRRMKITYAGMPNILADRMVAPELLQDAASPEAVARELERLLRDPGTRDEQVRALADLRSQLEPAGAIERTAAAIAAWAEGAMHTAGQRLEAVQ